MELVMVFIGAFTGTVVKFWIFEGQRDKMPKS